MCARLVDAAWALLDLCIEVDVPTRIGVRPIVQRNASKVRPTRPESVFWSIRTDYSSVATNSFSNMYPCPVQPGSYTKYWCCGLTEGLIAERHGECCKDGNFTFEATGGTGPFFSRDYNKTEPVSSSTPTTTLTLATTGSTSTFTLATADSATSPPAAKAATNRTSDKRDMTIGVAIAVPIAVITLSLLGVVLVREHRGRKHAEKMANDMMKAGHQSEGSRAHGRSLDPTGEMSESDRRQMTQELSSAPILLVELQSGQIYEAGGGS